MLATEREVVSARDNTARISNVAELTGGVVQVMEHLLCKWEALSSSPHNDLIKCSRTPRCTEQSYWSCVFSHASLLRKPARDSVKRQL
jgi:hypothetical protein